MAGSHVNSDTPCKPKAKAITHETSNRFMQMCNIFCLFFQECFSFKNGTFPFKIYS